MIFLAGEQSALPLIVSAGLLRLLILTIASSGAAAGPCDVSKRDVCLALLRLLRLDKTLLYVWRKPHRIDHAG